MKKLMTILSAVAVAFGLYATDVDDTGTSFEGLTAGEAYNIYQNGSSAVLGGELSQLDTSEAETYWETNDTAVLTIVNGTSQESSSKRPSQYKDAGIDRYLSIKTTLTNPVKRFVNKDRSTGVEIEDGFYFDSYVKFTAFDDDPTITLGADGKLAIWLKEVLDSETEEPIGTNLVVTAGFLDDNAPDDKHVVVTNYTCAVASGVNISDGGWHRVTVKAINNIYNPIPGAREVPGFVVYVDEFPVKSGAEKGISGSLTPECDSYNEDGKLFPSALQSTNKKSVITAVEFDGQGCVDDIVFTQTAPTFTQPQLFTVSPDEHVVSVNYALYNVEEELITNGVITAEKAFTYQAGMYIVITNGAVTCDAGYKVNTIGGDGIGTHEGTANSYAPGTGNKTLSITTKAVAAQMNGEDYETLAEAIADINDPDEPTTQFDLKLMANASGSIDIARKGVSVTLDLAGCSITGTVSEAAIKLSNGTLLITNSTDEIGHVVGVPSGNDPAVALALELGTLTIAGGCFDGQVPTSDYVITGDARIRIAENEEAIADLRTCAAPNSLEPEQTLPPVYYVVTASVQTTVLVNIIDRETLVATTNIAVGTKLVQPETPVYTGYSFGGWCTDPSDLTTAWDFDDDVEEAMTLRAAWTLDEYTVTYDLVLPNATNDESNIASYTVNTPAFTLQPAGCVGYTFGGWTNAQGTAVETIAGGAAEDIILGATWTINTYTVTFMYDSETEYDTESADYNTTLTVKPENPSKTGYSFKGWSTDGTAANIVDLDEYLVVADVTLYAVWEQKHDAGATFDPPSGYTAPEFVTAVNNGTVPISNYLAIPDGVASSSGYCALFKATNINDKVEFVLNETAEAAVEADANAAAATIVATPGSVPETLTIDAEPGLYYSISYGATLTNMSEGNRTQAKDTGAGANVSEGKITLTMPTQALGATSGFYKVIVSIADKPVPNQD